MKPIHGFLAPFLGLIFGALAGQWMVGGDLFDDPEVQKAATFLGVGIGGIAGAIVGASFAIVAAILETKKPGGVSSVKT